jgi:Tfp pilus assembly protein PilP
MSKRGLLQAFGSSLLLLAAGCSSDVRTEQEVKAWIAEQEKSMRGAVAPLPQLKPFLPERLARNGRCDGGMTRCAASDKLAKPGR